MTHPKKVWHRGTDGKWRRHTMEAVDANHAVRVDPANWSFHRPDDAEPTAPDHGDTEVPYFKDEI